MSVALCVQNLSKQYRIYDRPSARLFELVTRGRAARHRAFWALREVSFEVEAGTVVGITGPNGCGKSTLLQIIAGTLEPTHGEVFVDGRVAALLELGAGFNAEFTGLENIFMNASLLGFSRRETEARLPDILRFAEIGNFIHQPVKTYSSGMYVRLAFAIAVSADPRILLVDEALAVGDVVFQRRCLRRIKEMQEAGTTILFVSHDTAALRALCSRVILLNAGRVIADGPPAETLNRYQKIVMEREEAYEDAKSHGGGAGANDEDEESYAPLRYTYRHGDGSAEIVGARLLDAQQRTVQMIETGEALTLTMRVRFSSDVDEPVFGFLIRNRHGVHAYGTNTKEQKLSFGQVRGGEVIEVSFSFPCWLGQESYAVSLAAHSPDGISFDWMDDVLYFKVASPVLIEGVANLNASATGRRLTAHGSRAGDVEQEVAAIND